MVDRRHEDSDRLVSAMVTAFPAYLWQRLNKMGIVGGSAVGEAIDRGVLQLERTLQELVALPTADQKRSPLELCREATKPLTSALKASGVRWSERDAWELESHPDDRYGLFPSSSHDLGEEAWRLHLAWGMAKAKAVAGAVPADAAPAPRPAVALFGVAIDDRDILVDAITARDYRALIWRNPAALTEGIALRPELVLVDVSHPGAHSALRALAGAGVRSVATGTYVDDLAAPGLLALGAEAVLSFDRVLSSLDRLLPRIV